MDTLVVQVGARHGRVAEVTRSVGDRLTIGRGFDNDLILTDLHVAPHQLTFVRHNGQWQLHVQDQTNPVLLNNQRIDENSATLRSGDVITVGRTRLTVFAADQPVEPTRKLVLSNWLSLESVGVGLPLAILIGAGLLDMVVNFYYQSTDLKWLEQASSVLLSAVICLAWAGAWAIAGKIIRHQHHFGLQLIVASLMSLLMTFLGMAGNVLAFQLNSAAGSEAVDWLTFGVALFLLLKLNFLIATNVRNTSFVAALHTILLLGIFFGLTYSWEEEDFQSQPEHSDVLLPPPLRLAPAESLDAYLSQVRATFSDFQDND